MNHPVKGEKSLALMQRSLLGKQEESNATMQSTTSPAATSNHVTAAATTAIGTSARPNNDNHNKTSNSNPLQHGQNNPISAAVSEQTSNPVSSSSSITISNTTTAVRSKGKDIAQLQRLSPDKVSILQKSQTAQLPSQQTLQPQTQQQQPSQLQPQTLPQPQPISAPNTDASPQGTNNINTSTTTTTPTTMKSKGKDFASMMSRAPPSVHAIIDLNRQNAARKAAGLPPILAADGSNVISGGSDVSLTAGASLSLLQPQPLSQPQQLQQPLQPQQPLQLQQHSLQDSNQSIKSNVPTFPTNNQHQSTIPQPPPPTHTLPEIKVMTKPKPTPKPTKVEGFMNASLSLSSNTTGGTAVTHANNPSRQQSLAIRVKLSNILKSMDPSGLFSLEADAEEKLISLANDFANSLVKKSTKIANHRHYLLDDVTMDGMAEDGLFHGHGNHRKKRKCVEVDDVAFVLKKNYGMTIPGLPSCRGSNKRGLLSSISTSTEGVNLATARVLGSAAAMHHPKKDDAMEGGNRGDVGTNPKASVERSVDVSTVDAGGGK